MDRISHGVGPVTTESDNPVAYARGVLQVEADTYRRQRDTAVAALEYLLAALDGGQQWDIDAAIQRGVIVANHLREEP